MRQKIIYLLSQLFETVISRQRSVTLSQEDGKRLIPPSAQVECKTDCPKGLKYSAERLGSHGGRKRGMASGLSQYLHRFIEILPLSLCHLSFVQSLCIHSTTKFISFQDNHHRKKYTLILFPIRPSFFMFLSLFLSPLLKMQASFSLFL